MGGGQEMFDIQEQSQNLVKELSKINFIVYFEEGNNYLFDSYKLRDVLAQEISGYFSTNHIKFDNWGDVGRGGGGAEAFIEILHELWRNKNIIIFIISTIKFFHGLYLKFAKKRGIKLKPQVNILLIHESDADLSKLRKTEIEYVLSRCLSNALNIGDSLIKSLSNKHGFIHFNLTIEARIKNKDYSFWLSLPSEKRTKTNISRLINLIRNIKLRRNIHSGYHINDLYAICRTDKNSLNKIKKYYLYYSTNILSDYFAT